MADIKGQEMLGLANSNYNRLGGSMLNPSLLTTSKNYLEVNVVTFNTFLFNNAAYIPLKEYSFWNAISGDYENETDLVRYYPNRDLKQAFTNIRLQGPSVSLQFGKHGFALTTGIRYMTSANRIPWEMPVMGFEGLSYEPIQNVNFVDYDIDVNTQGWMEIGLSYAYDIYRFLDQQITVGASLRLLWGYAGATAQVNNVDYIVLNDSTINFRNLNGQVGYAAPVDYENNDVPLHDPFFKGRGLGLDLGVTYTKRRYVDDKRFDQLCDQRYEDYIYRIGFSILDIGRIAYRQNAQVHSFDDVSAIWQNFDTISYDNVNQVVREISNVFYGDPDTSYRTDNFRVGMPMAVSLQFDYHFRRYENLYLGAVWVQPVRFNTNTLRRPAQLALIPRFEKKNLEFSVPISLYEYQYPRIGLAARFWFVSIGTDRLGTYLGLGDLNGLDFYMSIKLNFGKGSCKKKEPVECLNYEFGYSNKDKSKFKKRKKYNR